MGSAAHATAGDHVVGDDVVQATGESLGGGGHVGAAAHRTLATAAGTDVCAADERRNAGTGALSAPRPADAGHDAAAPRRASTDHVAAPTPHAGGSVVTGARSVDIGEDRPPVASCAMWHFSTAGGGAGGGAERFRPQAPPTKALAGTTFLGDRLAQPHAAFSRGRDERVPPSSCGGGPERLTPVPHDRRAEPPMQQLATGGAHIGKTSTSGRSTPLTRTVAPSPVALR